jgi:hypothetical protein
MKNMAPFVETTETVTEIVWGRNNFYPSMIMIIYGGNMYCIDDKQNVFYCTSTKQLIL